MSHKETRLIRSRIGRGGGREKNGIRKKARDCWAGFHGPFGPFTSILFFLPSSSQIPTTLQFPSFALSFQLLLFSAVIDDTRFAIVFDICSHFLTVASFES